jgi:hypothetical protein
MKLSAFKSVLKRLNALKKSGLIQDYAIGGGYAVIFHDVPYATYDLDIFVTITSGTPFTRLSPLYDHFRSKGANFKNEHILIDDIPVQFLTNDISPLVDDAIRTALTVDVEGVLTRVIRVEHLILLLLTAFRLKDRMRVKSLLGKADEALLKGLMEKFDDEKNTLRERYVKVLGEEG